jgi:threonine synthase
VGNPSNLERLRWLFGNDVNRMRAVITSTAYTDDEVRLQIRDLYHHYDYVADPHTAIACLGLSEARGAFLATAHPAKFREVVAPAIEGDVPLPPAFSALLARNKQARRISPAIGELAKLL